jgi:hypothetical protein
VSPHRGDIIERDTAAAAVDFDDRVNEIDDARIDPDDDDGHDDDDYQDQG